MSEYDWMNASLMKKERTERKKAKAKRKSLGAKAEKTIQL